jgi:hypothetical protein
MNRLGNDVVQAVAITFSEKDRLPMIAPQGDVIKAAGDVQAKPARH